ncbi:MAG: flagellar basal body rod C-terminal domain-containing protein [Pseudomonadota bacterium]
MPNAIDYVQASLLYNMQAVEVSTFKVANMNRPVQSSGDSVFIEMTLNNGGRALEITNGQSVQSVAEVDLKSVYQPDSPDADENGFVQMMDIDLAQEMVHMSLHKRAYELGVKMFNTHASMRESALRIGS